MSQNTIIRLYQKSDREAVRRICCDVADRGNPIEGFFPDRSFAANLLMTYYTDYEPKSTFVAENSGEVVAYINGGLDNRRYGLVMFWIIIPYAVIKAFKRGTFFRREFWQIVKGSLRNWKRLFTWRKKSFHSHQAHMHIGIMPNFRKQRLGELLVKALCDYAKTQGVTEMTASVHDGNVAACRFFERMGFHVKESYPMIETTKGYAEHYHGLLYAKEII